MKAEKIAVQLEKMVEKLEAMSHHFEDAENQNNFDANKGDVIALLNDMIEIAREDAENETEEDDDNWFYIWNESESTDVFWDDFDRAKRK